MLSCALPVSCLHHQALNCAVLSLKHSPVHALALLLSLCQQNPRLCVLGVHCSFERLMSSSHTRDATVAAFQRLSPQPLGSAFHQTHSCCVEAPTSPQCTRSRIIATLPPAVVAAPAPAESPVHHLQRYAAGSVLPAAPAPPRLLLLLLLEGVLMLALPQLLRQRKQSPLPHQLLLCGGVHSAAPAA